MRPSFVVEFRNGSLRAPLARVVAFLALLVVVQVVQVSRAWRVTCSIARVLWCAMVVGRPGRVYRGRQSWRSIWRDGIADFA